MMSSLDDNGNLTHAAHAAHWSISMTALATPPGSRAIPGASKPPSSRDRAMVPTLILVGLVTAVMSSVGAPLVPSIAKASHVSLSAGEWLLTITLLTGALATPIMGRFSDGPYQRRVIVASLGVVLVGSVLAAMTSAFPLLILGRGLQGLGLGLMPVTMAIARRHLPAEHAGRTIATLSVTAAVGAGLGFPITGLLAEVSSYHAAFWFCGAVVAIALVLSVLVLPAKSDTPPRHFDAAGATLLCLGLALFIVVVSDGEEWGWSSLRVIGLGAAAVALLGIWAGYELHIHQPLVDLRQARNRMVLTADLSGLIISLTMYLFLPIVVEFVQVPRSVGYGFGSSVVISGCVLIPLSASTLIASRVAVVCERRYGRRMMIPIGSVLFAIAMAYFAFEHASLWEAFMVMFIGGLGIGFTFAAMPGFIVASVHARDTGSAMGFYQVLRSIGLALGSAVSGAILASNTHGHSAFPAVGGFRTALVVGAVLCLVTAAMSYVLPGNAMHGPEQISPAEAELMEENAELGGAGLMLAGEGE
jgi:MFS family permease